MSFRAAVIFLAALLAAFAAAAADSRYCLKTTEYTLCFDNLPPELDGMRIAHLSDLHGSRFGRRNERLVRAVLSTAPDIIAMTGDMASDIGEVPAFEELVSGIAGAAPIYYVNGNHEWAGHCVDTVERMLKKYGVRCLRNEYEPVYMPGSAVHFMICGADDPNSYADMKTPDVLAAELNRDYPDEFVLWLCHRNDYIMVKEYNDLQADLILCGHAHGGVIRLPFVGGLLNLYHRLGAEYEKGIYRCGRFTMEVSTGLGNSIPVPRLFNRPEISVITLKTRA